MRAKVKSVTVWSKVQNDDGIVVYEAYYSTGNIKRFYSSYTQHAPNTVLEFCYNEEKSTKRKLNNECDIYEEV